MSKQITAIHAKNNQSDKKLKVAAYCRVSTEHEEQRQSLKSQVAYYMKKSVITRIGISPVFMLNRNLARGWIIERKFSD